MAGVQRRYSSGTAFVTDFIIGTGIFMELYTERLQLVPWNEDMADELYVLARDPQVGPAAGWAPHSSVEESRDIICNVLKTAESYAIQSRTTGKLIGAIALKGQESSHLLEGENERELGFWIGVPFWNRGYCSEAAREMIRHGFEDLRLSRIWCAYYKENERSKRTQASCGFIRHHVNENVEVPAMHETRTEIVNCLTEILWQMHMKQVFRRMNIVTTGTRIYSRTSDGKMMADIEFPELQKGQYKVVNLYVDPAMAGWNLPDLLMRMACQQVIRRGGRLIASDGYAAAWLAQHGL